MTAVWMAWGVAVAALLGGAAVGAEAVCRSLGRSGRWAWGVAMVAAVALMVAAPWWQASRPALDGTLVVEASVAAGAASSSRAASLGAAVAAVRSAWRGAVAGARGGLVLAARRIPARADRWLEAGWLALSLLALLLLLATHWRLGRERESWPLRDVDGVRVRVSPRSGPAAIGWLRAEIVIPEWVLLLERERRSVALAHEVEHVRARDPLLITLGWFLAVALAWNPVVWWMLSRLRLAVEVDCDARVLGRGVGAASYGSLLIDFAGRRSGLGLSAAALLTGTSQLERRIRAMKPTFTRTGATFAATLGGLALLAVVAACDAGLPTAAEVENMDATTAESTVRRAEFAPAGGDTRYYLDRVSVSEREAKAVGADRISRIRITKAAGGSAIWIATKEDAAPEDAVPEDAAQDERAAVTRAMAGEPLIFIDGVRAKGSDALRSLDPDRIASIDVIKGPAAAKLYSDATAANGVIQIRTKGH